MTAGCQDQLMEEIYANVECDKPVCQTPASEDTGSSSSKRRQYLCVIIVLGILNVFLLAGLIILGVYSLDLAANLSSVNENLTERLRDSSNQLSSMITERDLLNADLTELRTNPIRCREKACPLGWTRFSCSCYLLSTTKGSWDEGRMDCREKAADLVVIEDKEEQDFLSTFAKAQAWIGLTDEKNEGTFQWVDGTSMTFSFWAHNQPDNGLGDPKWGEEDYVHLEPEQGLKWNDVSCKTFSAWWICEKLLCIT